MLLEQPDDEATVTLFQLEHQRILFRRIAERVQPQFSESAWLSFWLTAVEGRPLLQPTDNPDSLGRFGRYEIVKFLGRGGMGIVMRGFDPALNRHSAIKALAPELASSAAARRRFSREAKSAAAVVHPHVVPILTVDEQEGLPYLVMPVVEGQSLQQRVDATGPLEVVEVLRIAAQIAEGLAAAHNRGLVHRDIKPANILLENGVERVQITDFGLARAADDASMTRSGVVAGTPQYMSPEQAHGDEIDHRSDLFSLGSVMYFMLTGRSPFRCATMMGVLNRIGNDQPRRLRSVNPGIPHGLADIVHRLLEKHPSKRFATAESLATELHARLNELQNGTEATATQRISFARPRPPSWPWTLLIGGAGMLTLLLRLVLIETDRGTIRTEANAAMEVPVQIREGDERVERLAVTSGGKSQAARQIADGYAATHAVPVAQAKVVRYTVIRPAYERRTKAIRYTQMTAVREQRTKTDPKTGKTLTYNVATHVPEERVKILNYTVCTMVPERWQKTSRRLEASENEDSPRSNGHTL